MQQPPGQKHPIIPAILRHASAIVAAYICLTVIYGNLAMLLNQSPLKTRLPAAPFSMDMFNIAGVFSYYETINRQVFIEGRVSPKAECAKAGQWIQLEAKTFLPFSRGEQEMRLWVSRQYNEGGPIAQQKGFRQLARKIRNRHNRIHPQCPLTAVSFGVLTWPRSPQGFETLKTQTRVKRQTWYAEQG